MLPLEEQMQFAYWARLSGGYAICRKALVDDRACARDSGEF